MAIKDELFSSAIDSLGNYLHSALDIFLNNLAVKESHEFQTKAETLKLESPAITESDSETSADAPFSLPIKGPCIFMNRKIVVCPECGNFNANRLTDELDDKTCEFDCEECGLTFAIKCLGEFNGVQTLILNDLKVSCPVCKNIDASQFRERGYDITCLACGNMFSVKQVLYPSGFILDN